MAFTRPTLQQNITRIQGDITGRLGQSASVLRRSFTKVISTAFGGAVHLLYGYIDYLARQIIPDTAEDEELVRWASIFGIERTAAEFAEGPVDITATGGTVIPVDYLWERSDGAQYGLIAQSTVSGMGEQNTTVQVRALVAGDAGNLDEDQALTVLSPLTGLDSDAVVGTGGIVGGVDQESIEALRSRLVTRTQQRPQGGAAADYRSWALSIAGVGRVFPYGPSEIGVGVPAAGEVYVFIATSDPADPVPDAGVVSDVQTYIDTVKPLTATVSVDPVTAVVVNFVMSVRKISGSTEADVEAAIEAELSDLFFREGSPLETIRLSQINEAISTAQGEDYHTLSSPSADVVLDADEVAVVGTVAITFV